ncbi:MAG: DUF3189 family protein [Syntrophomonas sp.]
MKIIFLGTSGVHHPLIAANIFLGRLHKSDFRFARGFCDTYHDESGYPIFIDKDQDGNEVYTLGVGPETEVGYKSIKNLADLVGYPEKELNIKTISIPGERLVYYAGKIPKLIGGRYINQYLSNYLIGKEFSHIKEEVDELRHDLVQ